MERLRQILLGTHRGERRGQESNVAFIRLIPAEVNGPLKINIFTKAIDLLAG